MRQLLAALCMVLAFSSVAAPLSVTEFSRDDEFKGMKISPDGKHLAVLTPVEGKNALAILDINTMKPTYVVKFSGEKQVGQFHWANNERVILTLEKFKPWYAGSGFYGEWYAVNLDGKRREYIFGYRGADTQAGTRVKQREGFNGWGTLVDLLPENEDEILMMGTPWGGNGDARIPTLFRVNVYTGKRKTLSMAPVRNSHFVVDTEGKARFVSGISARGDVELYYRAGDEWEWTQVDAGSDSEGYFRPIAFADQNHVYAIDGRDGDTTGLYKVNMDTGERKLLFRDDTVNISTIHFGPMRREMYAVTVSPDYPNYIFVRGSHPTAKALKNLLASFPSKQVVITSQSLDGRQSIVLAYSDVDPGQYFLYDAEKNALRALVKTRAWVTEQNSGISEAIAFNARDGKTIRGYLTLPPGQTMESAKDLPMVVYPHGGPEARDYWGYHTIAQLFASRGMAVLQVNFRGSTGYGDQFEHAGRHHWGDKVQYDIIDGTRHIIERGIAKAGNICIAGASFGGYSALQSAILEPDLYACSIGMMGVYDLPMLYEEGDIPDTAWGRQGLQRRIGEDMTQLKAFSPVYHVDKLKAPVLIIHGEEDERAPIEHAEKLKAALEAERHPFRYIELSNEAHGFADLENREKAFSEMLSFLDEHLKL